MQYKESNLKFGLREAGFSITIMHLFTQYCQLDNIWQNIQYLPFQNTPIHLISPPPNSFLFPKLKIIIEGRGRSQTVEDIITNVMKDLKALPQTSFEQCSQKWKKWWERCVSVRWDYFEGDNI
jgi:hypothetical protein